MNFKDKVSSLWNKISDQKYHRYYLAAIVLLGIIFILTRCTNQTAQESNPMAGAYQNYSEVTGKSQTEQDKKLNKLITNYYKFYAAGDTDSLQKIAKPISNKEISYIKFFSEYVTKYQNISIYAKRGLDDKSYLVSVVMDIKFKDAESTAAGMDFFYVMTDDNGGLYIANQYSSFNTGDGENEMDSQIAALIATFEQQDDVVDLQKQVQQKFNEALLKDEALNTLLTTTLPNATTQWASSYVEPDATQVADASTDEKKDEEGKEEENKSSETTTETPATTGPKEVTVDGLANGSTKTLTQTVRVRSDMNETASIAAVAYTSEPITIGASYDTGWTAVTTYSGASGYVRTDLLK